MSTLAFSAGMAAPLVYLSFSFYDRYGFSKKLCNAFCAASCIAAALTALLSIVLKLSVEFAALSCIALLACCFIGRAFFRNKKERTCSENAASARINLIVRIFIVALLLCIGFFRRKLFDALLKQGAYSFFLPCGMVPCFNSDHCSERGGHSAAYVQAAKGRGAAPFNYIKKRSVNMTVFI